jgi:hypothetical protein
MLFSLILVPKVKSFRGISMHVVIILEAGLQKVYTL